MSAPALSQLQALHGRTGTETKFTCKCPAHDDRMNSLSVTVADDGKVLVHCHAGCETRDVVTALGCTMADLCIPKATPAPQRLVCSYTYHNADGVPVGRVNRYHPKTFKQCRYEDGRFVFGLNGGVLPLYNLPAVRKAKAEGCPLYMVEGEKDVDALTALGVTATTIAGGAAQALHDSHVEALMGCDLIVLPDNDPAGIKAARARADAVWGSTYLMLPGLPPKGDVSDWIAQGGTLEALEALVAHARENPEEPEPVEQAQPVRPDVDPLGELANAYRFKNAVDGKIINDPTRGWMADKDGYWQPGERDAIKAATRIGAIIRKEGHASTDDPDVIRAYYSAARRAESARGVKATLELARALPGVDGTGIEWDKDDWLVNFKNCTLDTRTLTPMPHERSDYITRQIPHDYHPEKKCPILLAHLHKVFAGNQELINYLQFEAGRAATGSTKHQTFVIAHGKAGTAKTTTLEALMFPLGDYAGGVSHDVVLHQHSQSHACTLAALAGLRLGLVSELPEGARWNEAMIKRLVTGDTITARFIGCNPFNFKSRMKLWVNCNDRPEFRDAGGGMARRIRCIPFEVDMTGEGRDLDIEEKLRAEAAGILTWIMQGAYISFQGSPEVPEVVRISSRDYVRQNDMLANFLDECCEVDPRDRAEVGATFDAFHTWGGDLSKRRLGKLLLSRFDQYSDGKVRFWTGFKLKCLRN